MAAAASSTPQAAAAASLGEGDFCPFSPGKVSSPAKGVTRFYDAKVGVEFRASVLGGKPDTEALDPVE